MMKMTHQKNQKEKSNESPLQMVQLPDNFGEMTPQEISDWTATWYPQMLKNQSQED